MKIVNGIFVLTFSCLSLPVFAGQEREMDGSSSSYTRQASVLAVDSPAYTEWKAWINEQNNHNPSLKRKDGTFAAGDVGKVTIYIQTEVSGDKRFNAISSMPPDNGPPTPLPVNGIPGQKISIKNQTTTLYQRWTFEWVGESIGGGWDQTGYAANTCQPKPGMKVLCAASID